MKICMYTETALPKIGGQEFVVDTLAREYLQLGHDVTVLAPYPRRPLRAHDADKELPYHMIRHPRFFSTKNLVRWYRYWLQRLHQKAPFDILHCHSLYPTGYLASLCRERLQVPVVVTSHGGDVNENSRRVNRAGLHERYRQGAASADALVAISRYTEEGLLRMGAEPSRLHRIPNGVQVSSFTKRATRPAQLDPTIQPGEYVLFLGRLTHRKGVDLLLRALTDVPANGKVQTVIAGAGDLRDELQTLAVQWGIHDRVRFVGAVMGETKSYLLQNARCTIVPSRGWEAFGLVVLESYAAGTPVVAARLTGMAELVQPNKTGWLVSPEAPEEISHVLRHIFSGDVDCRQLGQRAARMARNYDWRLIARKHMELYENLLQPRTRWLRVAA